MGTLKRGTRKKRTARARRQYSEAMMYRVIVKADSSEGCRLHSLPFVIIIIIVIMSFMVEIRSARGSTTGADGAGFGKIRESRVALYPFDSDTSPQGVEAVLEGFTVT